MVAVGASSRTDSSPARNASRSRSSTQEVLPEPAGPINSRIGYQCTAGEENTKATDKRLTRRRRDMRVGDTRRQAPLLPCACLSGYEEQLARGLAAFEGAVSVGGFGQGVGALDARMQLAGGDPA